MKVSRYVEDDALAPNAFDVKICFRPFSGAAVYGQSRLESCRPRTKIFFSLIFMINDSPASSQRPPRSVCFVCNLCFRCNRYSRLQENDTYLEKASKSD